MITKVHTRQIPLVKLALLLAIGIALFRTLQPYDILSDFYVLIVLLISLPIYYWVHYKWKTPILMLIVILVGLQISGLKEASVQYLKMSPELVSSQPVIEVEVEDIRHYKKSIALIGSIVAVNQIARASSKVILYGRKNDGLLSKIKRGSIITTGNRIEIIGESENQTFEAYNSYLIDQGIHYTGFINPNQYEVSNSKQYAWWKVIRYDVRESALFRLDQYLAGEANAITRALLLGDKSRINKDTREKYAHSGIIHILAVSGLHVGFIAWFLILIFDRLLYRLSPYSWVKVVVISMTLLGYEELSGGAPPVRRAVIMAILYLIAKALRKDFSPINILGFAALVLLCISPNELFTVSFQLSFAAVGGIILFVPYLMSFCEYEQRIVRKVWGIISVGIAAQIATFPITFYYFNQVPVFSALAGVVAIPFTGFALCNGALILLLGGIDYIGDILVLVQNSLIIVLNGVASFISNIPFSIWDGVSLVPIESILLLFAIVAVAFYLITRRSIALVIASFLLLVQASIHSSIVILNYKNDTVGVIFNKVDAANHSETLQTKGYE